MPLMIQQVYWGVVNSGLMMVFRGQCCGVQLLVDVEMSRPCSDSPGASWVLANVVMKRHWDAGLPTGSCFLRAAILVYRVSPRVGWGVGVSSNSQVSFLFIFDPVIRESWHRVGWCPTPVFIDIVAKSHWGYWSCLTLFSKYLLLGPAVYHVDVKPGTRILLLLSPLCIPPVAGHVHGRSGPVSGMSCDVAENGSTSWPWWEDTKATYYNNIWPNLGAGVRTNWLPPKSCHLWIPEIVIVVL